jgi:hypothetical protein
MTQGSSSSLTVTTPSELEVMLTGPSTPRVTSSTRPGPNPNC